jgi:hypothetical protein
MFVYFDTQMVNLTSNSKLKQFSHELKALWKSLWELTGSSQGACHSCVYLLTIQNKPTTGVKRQRIEQIAN